MAALFGHATHWLEALAFAPAAAIFVAAIVRQRRTASSCRDRDAPSSASTPEGR